MLVMMQLVTVTAIHLPLHPALFYFHFHMAGG